MTRSVSVRVSVALVIVLSVLAAAGAPASAADAAMQSDGLVVASPRDDGPHRPEARTQSATTDQ